MTSSMKLTLKIWRQKSAKAKGCFLIYKVKDILPEMSFLEMLDKLNEDLIKQNKNPVLFESDCREGICGACSLVVNGIAHGKENGTTVCQLRMRSFENNEIITIEPWRAKAFPLLTDLIVDRSALDRIMQKGGYISINIGAARDANNTPITKKNADAAFDTAACIGCGACVAACKNASAMLFLSAKISQLKNLPQGQPERKLRVVKMLEQMDLENFGNCTNTLECEAVCPKKISTKNIAILNFEYLRTI